MSNVKCWLVKLRQAITSTNSMLEGFNYWVIKCIKRFIDSYFTRSLFIQVDIYNLL